MKPQPVPKIHKSAGLQGQKTKKEETKQGKKERCKVSDQKDKSKLRRVRPYVKSFPDFEVVQIRGLVSVCHLLLVTF